MSGESKGSIKSKARRSASKSMQILKEWGGAATLLIAILYTFPFDAFDRYSKWRDSDVTIARHVLAEAATISIDAAKTAAQLGAGADISGFYSAKFWNAIYPNREALARAVPKLKSNEVAQVGSYFYQIGLSKEAVAYYDAAIEKVKQEGLPPIRMLREKGVLLFDNSPARDVARGREAYVESIKLLGALSATDVRLHTIYLLELAQREMDAGDWLCGQSLYTKVDPVIRTIAEYDPYTRDTYQRMRAVTVPQKVGQPEQGCPEILNLMPVLPRFQSVRPAAQPVAESQPALWPTPQQPPSIPQLQPPPPLKQ
jgi:hypothetical protein